MNDITAVLMTHAEGRLLEPTYLSFEAGITMAEEAGMSVERIVTVDNPTDETLAVLACLNLKKYIRLDLSLGDLGRVRNEAAAIASGKYFAVLDGDDLWSENWLKEAFELSKSSEPELVVHPEMNWLFDGNSNIFYHVAEDQELYQIDVVRSTNPWDSLCFCRTNLIRGEPYVKRDMVGGFAYEDWNWNRRVIELGIQHAVAPKTIIFKRRRSASQGAKAAARGVIPKPSASAYYDFYE